MNADDEWVLNRFKKLVEQHSEELKDTVPTPYHFGLTAAIDILSGILEGPGRGVLTWCPGCGQEEVRVPTGKRKTATNLTATGFKCRCGAIYEVFE